MLFEHDDTVCDCGVKIKIIGVGGGGGNAVNRMVASNIQGVEIYALNTDKLAFRNSDVPNKVIIGEKITRGYGAVYSESGNVLTSISEVNSGDNIRVRFKDGTVGATVNSVTKTKNKGGFTDGGK